MIEKLLGVLPEHKDYLDSLQGKVLYVADWKDENNGGISFTDYDVERAAVRLLNPSRLSVFCDKFPENALPIKKGCFSQQCECILFPQDEAEDTDDWRLFIETKYAKDEAKARDERNNYPQKMVGQIEATVEYFRNKGILEENQVVYAIVSSTLSGILLGLRTEVRRIRPMRSWTETTSFRFPQISQISTDFLTYAVG